MIEKEFNYKVSLRSYLKKTYACMFCIKVKNDIFYRILYFMDLFLLFCKELIELLHVGLKTL